MTLSKSVVAASALSFLISSAASPALAQHRGGGQSRGGGSRSGGGGGSHATAGPRSAPSGPRTTGPSRSSGPRVSAPSGAPRFVSPSRGYVGPSRSYSNGSFRGYAGPRGGVTVGRSAAFGRPGGYAYGSRGFAYRGYGYVAPIRFIRPYYVFRPRFSIGFGIWAGFPFAYSYPYYYPYDAYPYGYPYDYSYGDPYPPSYGSAYPPTYGSAYPPAYGSAYPSSDQVYSYPPVGTSGSVGVQPGTQNQNGGGLSFDITPTDAEVFVDGVNVGTVGQFTPTSQPLGLTPGRHRIELRAPGYQTISFDADIVAGQVAPYQGTMQR